MTTRSARQLDRLLGVAGLLAACVIAVWLVQRHAAPLDWTEHGANTLEPATVSALRSVGSSLEITVFRSRRREVDALARDAALEDLMAAMAEVAGAETRVVDLDRDPELARTLGVTRQGTVVVAGPRGRVDIPEAQVFVRVPGGPSRFIAQGAIRAALARLSRDGPRRVGAITGHGESSVDGGTPWVAVLRDAGIGVRDADLLLAHTVADDLDGLVWRASGGPLTPLEEMVVRDHVRAGGGLVIFTDGVLPAVVADAGIAVKDGVIRGARQTDQGVVVGLGSHEAASLVGMGHTLLMSEPRALSTLDVPGVSVGVIAAVGADARLDSDARGPFSVAVGLSGPAVGGRIAVVGDEGLLSTAGLQTGPGNAALVAAVVGWAIGDDEVVGPGRVTAARPLAWTRSEQRVVRAIRLGAWPGLWLVLGLGAAMVRRRR